MRQQHNAAAPHMLRRWASCAATGDSKQLKCIRMLLKSIKKMLVTFLLPLCPKPYCEGTQLQQITQLGSLRYLCLKICYDLFEEDTNPALSETKT